MKEKPTNMKPCHQDIPSLPLEPNNTLLSSSHYHLQLSSSKAYHHLQSDGDDDNANNNVDYDEQVPDNDHLSGDKMNVEEESRDKGSLILKDDCGRERLKRHRIEVAGRVWIPEMWGQEEFLKDWIDCSAFDAPLMPSRIVTARAALVEEGRRATSARLRIENRLECLAERLDECR